MLNVPIMVILSLSVPVIPHIIYPDGLTHTSFFSTSLCQHPKPSLFPLPHPFHCPSPILSSHWAPSPSPSHLPTQPRFFGSTVHLPVLSHSILCSYLLSPSITSQPLPPHSSLPHLTQFANQLFLTWICLSIARSCSLPLLTSLYWLYPLYTFNPNGEH